MILYTLTPLRHVSELQYHLQEVNTKLTSIFSKIEYIHTNFDVFLTVHHSIDLFHLPTLMHNSFIH